MCKINLAIICKKCGPYLYSDETLTLILTLNLTLTLIFTPFLQIRAIFTHKGLTSVSYAEMKDTCECRRGSQAYTM